MNAIISFICTVALFCAGAMANNAAVLPYGGYRTYYVSGAAPYAAAAIPAATYTAGAVPAATYTAGAVPAATYTVAAVPSATYTAAAAVPAATYTAAAVPAATYTAAAVPAATYTAAAVPAAAEMKFMIKTAMIWIRPSFHIQECFYGEILLNQEKVTSSFILYMKILSNRECAQKCKYN
ncbi:hypothetical protein TNCT_269811 [Trichonephila clavata]|uniref:Uncharacterized protein n=1 Tax=Trichonephila clavata TaxID=2740835 RepID=A0A8X6KTE0_TRICU|nr:hypothetical protein TNCT_269811 [Trichonephila clavata]